MTIEDWMNTHIPDAPEDFRSMIMERFEFGEKIYGDSFSLKDLFEKLDDILEEQADQVVYSYLTQERHPPLGPLMEFVARLAAEGAAFVESAREASGQVMEA